MSSNTTHMELTAIQQSILAMITEHIACDGCPPSQTEIARAFGFKGVRGAQYHLTALERAGAITRLPGKARGIRLAQMQTTNPDPSASVLKLPILGRVAAGRPIGADIQADDQFILLDRVLFSPAPDYLLKVEGDSMREEGIFDGDLVGVHRTNQAHSGQIIVARIDEEITIKLLRMHEDGIRLVPRNPDYAPIDIGADQDFAIEGLYCGLLRPQV